MKRTATAGLLVLWGLPGKAAAVAVTMTAALTGLAVMSTGVMTDSDIVNELAFDAGGIDLTVSAGSALVTMTTPTMTPGDSYTAPFRVGNAGNVELRYAMVSTTNEDILAGELVMTIRAEVANCDDERWDQSGTELYRGAFGSASTIAVFGSVVQGEQPGDRPIIGGADEELCFNVALPISAGNAAQGITSTATFAFYAEQTERRDWRGGAEIRRAD